MLDQSSEEKENLKENNKRAKIDKLLAKKDIKYRGLFTYRSIRVLGFILMLFSQIYLAYTLVNKIVDVPGRVMEVIDVLELLSTFALPMFLAANFCVIMSSGNKIKKIFGFLFYIGDSNLSWHNSCVL